MKEMIINILSKILKIDKKEIEQLIEVPPNSKLGDYSLPCFKLVAKLKINPVEIAQEIVEKLETLREKLPFDVEKIEQVQGYVNFFINKEKLADKLIEEILKQKERYGSKKEKGKGRKALIEHTSINPNASPHVGRSRNAMIGDSIVRILKFQGHKTETHYYVNDISKQVAMLVLICSGKEKFSELLKKYVEIAKKIEKQPELEKKVFKLLEKFEKKDKKTTAKFRKIVKIAVKGQAKILSKLGIRYNFFDYESDFMNTEKILSALKKTGKLFKDKENRYVLDQKGTQVENKMKSPFLVLTRSDGTGLYPLRDLAYTIYKLKKAGKTGKNIIVLGEDQKLYFLQLKEALKLLNQKAPEVVHYSFILITTKKGKEKMSTRKGHLVLLEDFMKEAEEKAKKEIEKRKTKGDAKKIAIGAVKYTILKNDPNKNIIFDWQQALNFEGESGPYLQYSYARASSILRKAKLAKKDKKSDKKIEKLHENEIKLIKKLSEFSEVVERAYKQLNPSIIANYSFQLAQIFNEFYHSCQVIGSEQENFRLKLVQAFRQTIKNALYLLGIEVMEEM